ncbi:MAG TPA: VOC family protein [Sphingobium sp.]|nr:VOC family protein [Sphingobium sp.]
MRIARPAIRGIITIAAFTAALAATAAPRAADLPPLPLLNHFMVAISVADLDGATRWYEDVLGFTVEREASLDNGRVVFRWLRRGNERIELVHNPAAVAGPARALPPAHVDVHGFTHLTLETADLAATRAALLARGVTLVVDITEVKDLGIKVLFLRDPEGNYIEIAERLRN